MMRRVVSVLLSPRWTVWSVHASQHPERWARHHRADLTYEPLRPKTGTVVRETHLTYAVCVRVCVCV